MADPAALAEVVAGFKKICDKFQELTGFTVLEAHTPSIDVPGSSMKHPILIKGEDDKFFTQSNTIQQLMNKVFSYSYD